MTPEKKNKKKRKHPTEGFLGSPWNHSHLSEHQQEEKERSEKKGLNVHKRPDLSFCQTANTGFD